MLNGSALKDWISIVLLAALLSPGQVSIASAKEPLLKTPAPVIYLADNLDEADSLGWCIDTMGRGFGEKLHAHSCKPQGGDVQFAFKAASGHIESAAFDGKCMTLRTPGDEKVPFGLYDCKDDISQKFVYDAETMQIRTADDQSQCVVVGAASKTAGPFMSRDLMLLPCRDADAARSQWRIKE